MLLTSDNNSDSTPPHNINQREQSGDIVYARQQRRPVPNVEKSHEAFRTMPVEGDLAKIQADMRPIAELCTGKEAHSLIQDVTLAHFNATLKRWD